MTIAPRVLEFCALFAVSSLVACAAQPGDDEFDEDLAALADEVDDEADEDEDEFEDADEDEPDTDGEEDEYGEEDEVEEEEPVPPRRAPILEGPCEAQANAACTLDGDVGVQYCWGLEWGPCVVDPMCEMGQTTIIECDLFGIPEATEVDCELRDGVPQWGGCGFTPLVLSFDGQEPTFDAGAASFELSDGSGECLAREWPGPDTPWLAIDLDGNGVIDNGRELLGSATPMPDGRRPEHGFEALAQHDSDHDGVITPRDEIWGSLLLWSDLDRDRVSSGWELTPVAYAGLTSIDLQHTVDARCDDRGNCGIERSTFSMHDGAGTHAGRVIDVHIPCD